MLGRIVCVSSSFQIVGTSQWFPSVFVQTVRKFVLLFSIVPNG